MAMSSTAAFVFNPTAQAAVLIKFLSRAAHSLSSERSVEICDVLALTHLSDFKPKALALREELLKDGICLNQTAALEALSQMAGFNSYMRVREAMTQQAGNFARDGFLLRFRMTGKDEPQFQPYDSLPLAANAIIQEINSQLAVPGEAVFCELRRNSKSVVVEVCRSQGNWFSVELVPYAIQSEQLEIVEFDAESLRSFFGRLIRAIEKGHPGALVVYGVIPPPKLTPWHFASFNFLFHETGVQKVLSNERDLFLMFDGMGLRDTELTKAGAVLRGDEGSATMELAWICDDDEKATKGEITLVTLSSIVGRYRQWRRGLSVPIQKAILQVVAGADDAAEMYHLNIDALATTREKLGLSLSKLAESAGLSEQVLHRIEKFGQSKAVDIVAIARALKIDPNILVEHSEGQIGIHISEAKHLLNAMRNVHQYGISMPDELADEKVVFIKSTGENLTELCDLVQMQEGVFAELTEGLEPITDDSLLEDLQAVLDGLPNEGLMLIVSRGLKFAIGEGNLAAINGMPLHTITFRFQPVETANSLAVGL